jgi:hypothetical protein
MNGGTSLRPDAAVKRPLARSLNVASSIDICYWFAVPALAFGRFAKKSFTGVGTAAPD